MSRKIAAGVAAISVSLMLAGSASAAINLVTNGGFETNGGNGQVRYNTTLAGWTVQPHAKNYDFLFGPGAGVSGTTADTTGAVGDLGNLKLWGPGDGSLNGLTLSPNKGFFLAIDPQYRLVAPLSQVITGLTPGWKYTLSFDFAGSQQYGPKFNGKTTEGWKVGFGSSTQSTATLTNLNHGFTGWQKATMTFVPTSATQTLSFLATGGPKATLPPFALLDGVSLTAGVPEPASWALMIMGFGGIGAMVRNRRRQAIPTS